MLTSLPLRLVALVVVLSIGGCIQGGENPRTESSPTVQYSPVASPVATSTPLQLPTISPTSTEIQAPPGTPEQPQSPIEIPTPIVFSGEGDSLLEVNKWNGPALIRVVFSGPGSFAAWNLGNDEFLLALAIGADGPYRGTRWLDLGWDNRQTKYLEVSSDGSWVIEILPFEYGRTESAPGTFAGSNDDVIFLGNPIDSVMHVSLEGSYFAAHVYAFGTEFVPLIQGEAPLEEEVVLPAGVDMLVIETLGDWSVSISAPKDD